MTKLTDTEQVILTAISRNKGTVPTRERSKSKADPRAYGAAVASLLKKGILEFRGPAREGDFAKDGQKQIQKVVKDAQDNVQKTVRKVSGADKSDSPAD